MKIYHGTNRELTTLLPGSYVSRSIKDAWRFGYRRAVVEKGEMVFVYSADIDPMKCVRDVNRDRAYITTEPVAVELVQKSHVWDVPHKLKQFVLNTRTA